LQYPYKIPAKTAGRWFQEKTKSPGFIKFVGRLLN
jgi:hypothetical protein